jgi:hypothetical protein
MLMPSIRFYHYIVSWRIILANRWTCHPNIQSLSCKPSFKPCFSHHRNHKKFKMLNQPISIVCIAWSCLSWSNVFMLCYSYCYRLKGENVSCWEKWKGLYSKKASDTHASTYILNYALVFSILCMKWDFQRNLWNA